MKKFTKELKVGVLSLLAIAVLYLGLSYLKGSDVFSTEGNYYVIYDNVDGLQASNPVFINGLQVGIVKSIELMPEDGNKLKVWLTVKRNVKITKNTEIVLEDNGLISGKALRLDLKAGAPAEDNSQLKALVENGMMKTISGKAGPIANHADSLITNLNFVVRQFDQTGAALKLLLANANIATTGVNGVLASNSKSLSSTTANAAQITATLKQLAQDLAQTQKQISPLLNTANATLAKTGSFTDTLNTLKLNETVNELNKSLAGLQGVIGQVNAGKGSLGKLAKDDSLYTNLDRTAASINALLTDMKAHPKRYVHFSLFGKKDK